MWHSYYNRYSCDLPAVHNNIGRTLQDKRLEPLLVMLRGSGRKLFLATNSLWDYVHPLHPHG